MSTNHTAEERWQVYDEQGRPVEGRGVSKSEAYTGVLHGAAHVWVWRRAADGTVEVLLQFRAPGKRTWPERYDTSAAGHIDLDETPLTAALRETEEEIGISVPESALHFAGMHRCFVTANDGFVENEIRFIYVVQMPDGAQVSMPDGEVASVVWKPLQVLCNEAITNEHNEYVPHGKAYYTLIAEALEWEAA